MECKTCNGNFDNGGLAWKTQCPSCFKASKQLLNNAKNASIGVVGGTPQSNPAGDVMMRCNSLNNALAFLEVKAGLDADGSKEATPQSVMTLAKIFEGYLRTGIVPEWKGAQ